MGSGGTVVVDGEAGDHRQGILHRRLRRQGVSGAVLLGVDARRDH
jgi:hypothetical protein